MNTTTALLVLQEFLRPHPDPVLRGAQVSSSKNGVITIHLITTDSDSLKEQTLQSIGVKQRILNACFAKGIKTIGDLLNYIQEKLQGNPVKMLDWSGFGRIGFISLRYRLYSAGIILGQDWCIDAKDEWPC